MPRQQRETDKQNTLAPAHHNHLPSVVESKCLTRSIVLTDPLAPTVEVTPPPPFGFTSFTLPKPLTNSDIFQSLEKTTPTDDSTYLLTVDKDLLNARPTPSLLLGSSVNLTASRPVEQSPTGNKN
eukprot:Gregarina_sp_Pseudo_9__5372@NODE_64_length_4638_cov_86_865188_g59_i0_p8_GENE_NODE_64_length_4638_cov_86_865188_g59_i0NODE_64_length_4638_cov_86_865188_g59_i0_p8_ORF_typecomplete_len125_score11_69_NODE_64_length_4638_cov_86_865188_g59_i010381412